MSQEYTLQRGILRFKDYITTVSDNNLPLDGVTFIDFNNVEHINVNLDLSRSSIKEFNTKKVITAKKIFLPPSVKVINENLYWAETITVNENIYPVKLNSKRLHLLNIYEFISENYDTQGGDLVYLSGTVVNFMDKRTEQLTKLLDANFTVYSPGHHMTIGDKVADKYPNIVYDIDIKAMERADIIFFDLTNLSAGTCAELGYSIAKGWHESKLLVGIYSETKNFFINGLKNHIHIYKSIDEFIESYTQLT